MELPAGVVDGREPTRPDFASSDENVPGLAQSHVQICSACLQAQYFNTGPVILNRVLVITTGMHNFGLC